MPFNNPYETQRNMTMYKKLLLILSLSMPIMYIHAADDFQDEQSQITFTQDENLLVGFYQNTDPEVLFDQYVQIITAQHNFLTMMKPQLKDPRCLPLIQNCYKTLTERKLAHLDLCKFVSENQNATSIKEFAPRFAQCIKTLESQTEQHNEFEQRIILCLKIAQNNPQKKNNLGNWLRDSQSSKEKAIRRIIDEDFQQPHPNYRHWSIPDKNSSLRNAIINKKFVFETPQ